MEDQNQTTMTNSPALKNIAAVGIASFLLGALLTYGILQSRTDYTYKSSAREKGTPTPRVVLPTSRPSPTVVPVSRDRIENEEGLKNALDQLANANDQAVQQIQSLINEE